MLWRYFKCCQCLTFGQHSEEHSGQLSRGSPAEMPGDPAWIRNVFLLKSGTEGVSRDWGRGRPHVLNNPSNNHRRYLKQCYKDEDGSSGGKDTNK